MNDSERLLIIINELRIEKSIGIFDAIILIAEEKKIDVEDIVASLDPQIIEQIKTDALNMGIVCNSKLFAPKTNSLF